MVSEDAKQLFGFKTDEFGAHVSRTIMLSELKMLFDSVPLHAARQNYRKAIVQENALNKSTSKTRALTFRHLADLYGLDPQFALFRAFRSLWPVDAAARPVLTCQMALARDALLRLSLKKILAL